MVEVSCRAMAEPSPSPTVRAVRIAIGIAAFFAATVASAEFAFWAGHRASSLGEPGPSCAVLVMGSPSRRDGGETPVQRLRVEAGVRALRTLGCEKLVVSGGAVANAHPEAIAMARIAAGLGVPEEKIVRETSATNTWENVGCAWPYVRSASRIVLASDPLHAHRARRYLCRQQPSRCGDAVAAAAYQPFTLPWFKVPATVHEGVAALRDWLVYDQAAASDAPTCALVHGDPT